MFKSRAGRRVPNVACRVRENNAWAKALRAELGYDYALVSLPHSNLSRVVGAVAGESNVPRVFIDGEQIGGLEALQQWAKSAKKAA